MREHAGLNSCWRNGMSSKRAQQLDDNRELATSRDVEIAAMADDEIPSLKARGRSGARSADRVLPPDETKSRCDCRNPRGSALSIQP